MMDLYSSENEILLNPRWPEEDLKALTDLAKASQEELGLQGHVWIATSGSTSDSVQSTKLVAISKEALRASAESVNRHLQTTSSDIWTQVLPSFHVGGLGIQIRAQLSGARVVNALNNQKWDVEHFYKVLIEEKCTLSALVPTQVYDLVQRQFKAPASVRAVVIGGGAFSEDLYLKARHLGWPVLPSYGMTETSSQIATASLESLETLEYPEMKLLSHAQARKSAEGFLEVRASSLFTCYARLEKGHRKCWSPQVSGWFTTEDQGDVHDSVISVQGRSQDYIKIGGEGTNLGRLRQIFESCVNQVDASLQQELVLLDMESERLGSEIHLVVQTSSLQVSEIQELYSQKVLPFEKIRKVHKVDQIPRSDLGKVLWKQLRSLL
ncbi:menE; O-succinylbenzoate-CoA ligase [Bdellovibrio bacteriovorus W]|nr:menE; O-succinylbenzoate-CoA ligase [Bdellovibrio bacteriovorus W]